MNATIENMNLQEIPFSKKFNRLMLTESFPEHNEPNTPKKLFISVSRDDPRGMRFDVIHMLPTVNGEPVEYTYTATPWMVTLHTAKGDLELCYDTIPEVLKFRTRDGIGAQFFIDYSPHELFIDRLDGTVEAGFTSMGEFLFVPTVGTQTHNNKWIGPAMRATPTTIWWEPQDGKLEGYIHWSTEFVERQMVHDFDECVAENRADYEKWLEQFPPMAEKYSEVRKLAGYVVWTCYQSSLMRLKAPIMYMMRSGFIQRGTGWQQSDHAMAAWRNQELVFDLFYSFFAMQDEYGMIPDCANDRSVEYTATKPPFQGFALTWVLDHLGEENIDPKQCARIYDPICRWVNWWKTFRDGDRDGLMCYMHGDESGLDDAGINAEGVPVDSPDLQAYLALCMEALGRLARIMGDNEAAEKHFEESKALIDRMIDKLWNGEKFVCMLEKDHRLYNSGSVLTYVPIILGKRLPQNIIDKMAADLADPNKFYTPQGFTSESKDSPLYDIKSGQFALGMSLAVTQLIITVGLYWAGKTELAVKNAENWCDLSIGQDGPITDYTEKEDDPNNVNNPVTISRKKFPGGFVSWGTPVFFVMGEIMADAEKEGK